jgi:hypothetical protein
VVIKKWRKIREIDTCPECGCPIITIHNDSNVTAYAKCEDCDHETPLEFTEPYIYGRHGICAVPYEFPDINCRAWFQYRGEDKSPTLVVEENGKVICKRLAGRIGKDEASVRAATLSILKSGYGRSCQP